MGKDWYWGSGAAKSWKRGRGRARNRDTIGFSGCITAVFQYCLHQPSSSIYLPVPAENNSSMEAPRNSLELELESESEVEEAEKLHIPMGIMQIKTRASNDLSSEISCSPAPGTKTPTLVARLMGLDLLPSHSCTSPTPLSTNNKSIPGTCSLPDTPRASSSSSSTDHRRLSLQINISEEALEVKSSRRKKNKYQDENRISARQMAKQLKESVISTRVGLADITNNSPSRTTRRDEELLVKSKKSRNKSILSDSQEKQKQVASKKFIKKLKPPQTSDIIRKSKQQETSVKASTIHVIPDHTKCNKTPSFNPSQTQRKQSHVCDGESSCASHKYMQAKHRHNYKPSGDSEDSSCNTATCTQQTAVRFDPSIFHQFELTDTTCSTSSTVSVKHRKLLFHVVDEMLVQTCGFGQIQGSEDIIDGIIEGELSRWWFEEEEGESIVREILTGVFDTLLHESASMLFS